MTPSNQDVRACELTTYLYALYLWIAWLTFFSKFASSAKTTKALESTSTQPGTAVPGRGCGWVGSSRDRCGWHGRCGCGPQRGPAEERDSPTSMSVMPPLSVSCGALRLLMVPGTHTGGPTGGQWRPLTGRGVVTSLARRAPRRGLAGAGARARDSLDRGGSRGRLHLSGLT